MRVEGVDVSLAQLEVGLAWHFKRYAHEQTSEEPETYRQAEDAARAARIGLWQDQDSVAPWDWRRQARGSELPRRGMEETSEPRR